MVGLKALEKDKKRIGREMKVKEISEKFTCYET